MRDLDAVLKSARPRAIAALRRYARDLERAEDAFQDAAMRALAVWRAGGVPDNPTAWLIHVGRNRLIDEARRDRFAGALAEEPVAADVTVSTSVLDDDLLRLIFTCCHPALSPESQVALTLKVIAGLSTADVAAAFLVPVRTMEQRLARARRKLREAAIPYAVPRDDELGYRLEPVMATIYLVFNQGYSARRATLTDPRVCREAIWLARLLLSLFPGHGEISGLLALMLFHHARAAARQDTDGRPVRLESQDPAAWDHGMIAEASVVLRHVLGKRAPGPYQTQAAIAALHCEADASSRDWPQIAALYKILERQLPSPVVSINRAVALAEAGDAAAGLVILHSVEANADLSDYVPFLLARSALLRATGRTDEARLAMTQAIERVDNAEERRWLRDERRRLFTAATPHELSARGSLQCSKNIDG